MLKSIPLFTETKYQWKVTEKKRKNNPTLTWQGIPRISLPKIQHAEAGLFAWSIKWSTHSRVILASTRNVPYSAIATQWRPLWGGLTPCFPFSHWRTAGDAARERQANRDWTMKKNRTWTEAWFLKQRDDPWNRYMRGGASCPRDEILSETSSISRSNRVWPRPQSERHFFPPFCGIFFVTKKV